ncbi:MAG: 2,3-bisphosphoglycerate-independent phosphoglycerate mutase, partial [Thermoleophilia bacterium]|nr:2,3-bisphosphoglycerate-independent phosphoglycerate mutase [Thermoleophilia bacterium]
PDVSDRRPDELDVHDPAAGAPVEDVNAVSVPTHPAGPAPVLQPTALVILDGWGLAPPGPGNAVELANTPTFDALHARYPHSTLVASGLDVGLPDGQIGNSEVGHLNLGAGRVVYQDLTRIARAVSDGSFRDTAALVGAADAAANGSGVLHVVGLASFGGVHSHLDHIVEVVRLAARRNVREVRVHAITDGRDVAPNASLRDLEWLERKLGDIEATEDGCRARIVSVIGRYWAMDRDNRWDRTERAFDLFVNRRGNRASSARDAVRQSHEAGITDEFVEPYVIALDDAGDGIVHGDAVVFANFRPDRMRQLVPALTASVFDGFERDVAYRPVRHAATMTEYDATLGLPIAFPPHRLTHTLADVLEEDGIGQLHVAETEKYAHVTYFFNGGVEGIHDGEMRRLADSPRDVATYDLKPEMSVAAVADLFAEGFAHPAIGFAVVNFANPDMVGHTGVTSAAVRAVEAADAALARVVAAVEARGGVCFITADHGNAEQMLAPDGTPHTAHTTNLVPFIVTSSDVASVRAGRLADVAPTLLDLLGVVQPAQMTGTSLITRR